MPTSRMPYGLTVDGGLPVLPIPPVGGQITAGFNSPGPTTGPGMTAKSANIFFVNSATGGAADVRGQGLTAGLPFKTLNFALSQCTSNNGDIIFVGPQHVETVAAVAALTFPHNAAAGQTGYCDGVTVYFQGNELDRAQILFATSTTATVTIPANNVTLVSPRFVNSIDALAAAVSVTGTDLKVVNAEWYDGVAANTLIAWVTTAAAKRLSFYGYRYYEDKTGGGTQKTEHIRIVGGDHDRFEDVHITGNFSTAPWNNITTLTSELLFKGCSFNNLNATPEPAIAILTTSPGVAFDTLLVVASGSTWITASNKIAFDLASCGVIPGGTPASPV